MSVEHLTVGSTCPPITPGLLRCYSMKFCPYAQRTLLVLLAKDVKHEIVNINLVKKPEWFVEKNPLQKVPTLEKDGNLIFESLVTSDYLDEAYPGKCQLYPQDPWKKAHDRVCMEMFSKVSSPMYKVYSTHAKGETEEKAKAFEDIQTGLDYFEAELSKRGTKFFGGDKPGMLDYMIWPFGERLFAVEMIMDVELPQNRLSKMKSWMEDMKEDEVVKALLIPAKIHMKFLESAFAGNPDYDMKY